MTSDTLQLTQQLIAIESITPSDGGCQPLLIERLEKLGFTVESVPYQDTCNFWAYRGNGKPVFAFAGHTDVVAPGPLDQWHSPPFEPQIRDGYLYGRGAADMKGSLAAMITATERFLAAHPDHPGTIGFLITSAEEGPSEQGTPQLIKHLQHNEIDVDYCLVGEPTSDQHFGDTIKNGRRGSLTGDLTVFGKQGHIAYPHLAENPIHRILPALQALYDETWDEGNQYFQPTSFQISNLNSGTGAGNVIPGEVTLQFNFRYSTESTAEQIQQRVAHLLTHHKLRYQLDWTHYGEPFLTAQGTLTDACQRVIRQVCDTDATLSTSGGTSDGRYIAPAGIDVIEFGPINATIHQVNECVAVDDLDKLSDVYEGVLGEVLLG